MFNKPIFGVGPGEVTAAAVSEPAKYLPESLMTEQMIRGVDWEPFRVDASGQQWYQRSGESTAVEIHAEADIDDFDFDDDGGERTTEEIMSDFHRNCAIVKSRHARGELVGTDDIDEDSFND